ncbi:cast multi-domain related protein [Cyclospora cayetanensis]|uniref:Cast multi-domain related protein n=1 Tax=Cyclospora cayetanensis TaxID=88456 RepID=A0A1D3D146_9EIME|nr:cast multi-domain related protein [Cyclospora cayetanensis]
MCPEGSPTAIPCPPGTKQPSLGQATCMECVAGFNGAFACGSSGEICSGGTVNGTRCPAGFTCPAGTIVSTSFPCPVGTYSQASGESSSICIPCEEGFYCDSPGLTTPTAKCTGGYYCPPGTSWKEPITFCKHGEICPPGSAEPQDCPPNHYCNTVKLAEPSGRNAIVEYDVASKALKPLENIGASLANPLGLALDEDCTNLYIADSGNHSVVRHTFGTDGITRIIGTGTAGENGVETPPDTIQLNLPSGVVVDKQQLYVVDSGNKRVLRMDMTSNQLLKSIGRSLLKQSSDAVGTVSDADLTAALPNTHASMLSSSTGTSVRASYAYFELPVSAALALRKDKQVLVVSDAGARALREVDLDAETMSTLVDYSSWESAVVEKAAKSIAATGLHMAFHGVSTFYGAEQKQTGVLFADSYMHRVRRIEIETDLYSLDPTVDIPCPAGRTKMRLTVVASVVPAGAVSISAPLPTTGTLLRFLEAKTDLEVSARARTLTSGWFRSGTTTTCCRAEACLNKLDGDTKEEDLLVIELENPMDLVNIRIEAQGDQTNTSFIGAELRQKGSCSSFCGRNVESKESTWPVTNMHQKGKGSLSLPNASHYAINVESSAEAMTHVQSIVLRFHHRNSSGLVRVELTTRDTRGPVAQQQCQPGTYQPDTGAASCVVCPDGYYCDEFGLTTPKECPGYYCTEGSWTATPLAGMIHPDTGEESSVGDVCPPNHYCPQGASKPTACPRGTFYQIGGATSADECFQCSAGFACVSEGVQIPCAAGYVCLEGATTSTPTELRMGNKCPAGSYCPEGSFAEKARINPELRLAWTVQQANIALGRETQLLLGRVFRVMFAIEAPQLDNRTMEAQENFVQKDGSVKLAQPTPLRALQAHILTKPICPEGSAQPMLCPLGSIPSEEPDADDTCVPCPAGKYCRGAIIAGECLAGFFCGLGNWVPNPWMEQVNNEPYVPPRIASQGSMTMLTMENWQETGEEGYGGIPCPAGHYCPAGTTKPIACPVGSVRQGLMGRWETDCSICPKGFFCPLLSLVPEPCPAGHFCPLGSTKPRPCFGGTYNPHQEGSGTSSCLLCLAGYLCPGEGNGELGPENQCPTGHYCLEGSQQPIPCPPGTYADEQGLKSESGCKPCSAGTYCPSDGSSGPGYQCPAGHVCPSGTAIPRKCLQGTWCPAGSGEAQKCPAGAVCAIGSGAPQSCPLGSYCPLDKSVPIPCPAGYMGSVDRSDTSSLDTGCTICPRGTYSDETGMSECLPCPPGYVCLEGCSARLCAVLQSGTYNNMEGQTGCILCGATATSNSQATSCSCKGTNRSFQSADRSCVCLSGFHYIQGQQDLSDQDGVEPCQQTLYDECGDDTSRDATGACKTPDEVCTSQCGPGGGSFSSISGLCMCAGRKSLDEVCDETCRAARPQMILNNSTIVLDDPESLTGDREFALDELTSQWGLASGAFNCNERTGCTVRIFDTTLANMNGLVGVPQSLVDDIDERIQQVSKDQSRLSAEEINIHSSAGGSDFGYFGVSDPVQCLPLGTTVAWYIRPSPNPIYPVYLRNSLLNTNKEFDYGAFRSLDNEMQAGEQRILFLFTFNESGLYTFGLNSDQNKILVLRVMEARRLCREDALLPQLRTVETLAAVAAQLPSNIEATSLFMAAILAIAIGVMGVLVFLAAWIFTHQRLENFRACSKALNIQLPPRANDATVDEMADLVLHTQAKVSRKEDPGVLRARQALAKRLDMQDPRVFIAVLILAKDIQEKTETQCEQIRTQRCEGLSQLVEITKSMKHELVNQIKEAVNSEAWSKEADELREDILSSLLSLLSLKRIDLINNLARMGKEHEEVMALKKKCTQLLCLQSTSEIGSQTDSLHSSMLLPALDEKGQASMSSNKPSVEEQVESLLEEFRRAQADADDKLPCVTELYKAKLKTLLNDLMIGSAELELSSAKASLKMHQDEADERLTVGIYNIMCKAVRQFEIYGAAIEREVNTCIKATNKAFNDAKATISTSAMNSMEPANVLRAAVASSLKEARSRTQVAAGQAQDIISTLEAEALEQITSWNTDYQSEFEHMHDTVITAQNDVLNRAYGTETRLLLASMQTTRSRLLEQIHKRHERIHAIRCSSLLDELQVTLDASISVTGRKKRQQQIDEAVDEAAMHCEAALFQHLAKYGVDLATVLQKNPDNINAVGTMREELQIQHRSVLAEHREKTLESLRNQREEATEELWELESSARKKLTEEHHDQTEQIQLTRVWIEDAAAQEDAARNEYETSVFNIRKQHLEGIRELDHIKLLASFKQKLLNRINGEFLTRAAEARRDGLDSDAEETLLQKWKNAAADLEHIIAREREVYRHYAERMCMVQREKNFEAFADSQERRLRQTALTKSLELAEARESEEYLHENLRFSMNEVQRIVWRSCALSGGGTTLQSYADVHQVWIIAPGNKLYKTATELQKQLRYRRKKCIDYSTIKQNSVESGSKRAIAVLQSQSIQELSDDTSDTEESSRGAAVLVQADAPDTIADIVSDAQRRLEEVLIEIAKEQEDAAEQEKVEIQQESAQLQKMHEIAKRKLSDEHRAKLALVTDDAKEQLLREHENALSQMDAALEAEQKQQEERAHCKFIERQQRLLQKRREAEEQKQKAVQAAEAELEARLIALASKEKAVEQEELQRLANQGTDTAAVVELLARRHNKEVSCLLQELSLKKAEDISAKIEQFWSAKGGRNCDNRPDDVQMLYKAELQELLFVETQAAEDRMTLQLQELQHKQASEIEDILKHMECRLKAKQERKTNLSEQEQAFQLNKEAEAAAQEEIGILEQRMVEEEQQIIKEMEEKRHAYDRLLGQLRQRREAEERRRVLRQNHVKRIEREAPGSELSHLMGQFAEDTKLLDKALAEEAERQHSIMRKRALLRNAEKSERLNTKRLVEKQRFLINQSEIRRREIALNNARAGARTQRHMVETMNKKELEKRMELAHRLEEQRNWAPIWREIFEEEQNAGTFDSWEHDDEQITFAGHFATNLLHTERILISEAAFMRELLGGFRKLSYILSLIKLAPNTEPMRSQDEMPGTSSESESSVESTGSEVITTNLSNNKSSSKSSRLDSSSDSSASQVSLGSSSGDSRVSGFEVSSSTSGLSASEGRSQSSCTSGDSSKNSAISKSGDIADGLRGNPNRG